ncbi:MAG: ATP-binding protein [Lachnospiraceae bacterium]|nr:ATP-binding protein [Lachnospiraceae bacterium]
MPLSRLQYDAIMREYDQKQYRARREQKRRIRQVEERIPQMKRIEEEIGRTAIKQARRALGKESDAIAKCRKELDELREQKAALLEASGFPADYMEPVYECRSCRDTGFVGGQKCACFKKAEMAVYYDQSNLKGLLEQENFAHFTDRYYEKQKKEEGRNETVWQHMQSVRKACENYAAEFAAKGGNLLFTGPAGVGKTFLSHCIAKELMEQCVEVLYLSASELFEIFSKNMTSGREAAEEEAYRYVKECELLIIDDLGTEWSNSFTNAQFFNCINDRNLKRRATLISTNLSLAGLAEMYSERVVSRILSEYQILELFGEDIRIKKRLM